MALLCLGCNSNTPEPASADIASAGLRLSIVRMATDPFLQRFTLTMHAKGLGGCSSSTELFPDTGYAGRRNIYQAAHGRVYVVGQYDARIIDPQSCHTHLSEFRSLDRDVIFVGSFDQDGEKHWRYFPAAQRPELPFEKR
ncbi:hypothetical protein [Candidatus Nitrospira nitrificans]|uniref:Uncharacterized protein n=1 Tax=Candidatus Nitrospira nitrificans TaxID=1742973 RepID=A0A0S4LS61_9BACT|nr:hypothetical protein [Candidatus Nitrospira nitrificans]CUS38884.1 conserved hypothetical protein [Candidatus Nitrospira nitrificans]